MLYALYGTDTIRTRDKLHSLVDALRAKKPDASVVRVDDESFDERGLDELLHGQGLFVQKYIIVLDHVFQNTDAEKAIIHKLKDIAASDNIFILIEGPLLKAARTKVEKYAEKVQEYTLRAAAPKKGFDIFSLTNALGARDRKRLWILYQKAKQVSVSDEEIHGMLFWQVKSMLQARGARTASDAGLKPFVFQKSRAYSDNFSGDALHTLSSELVSLYHLARRGERELGTSLELFILNI